MATSEELRQRIGALQDPELRASLGELGMVRSVEVDGERATVTLSLTTMACPLTGHLRRDVERVAAALGLRVELTFDELTPDEKATLMATARRLAQRTAPTTSIPDSASVVVISSGKGGVGKSSVTVNLAAALAARGLVVGILDADIWGFSIPRLAGVDGDVTAAKKKMIPLTRTIGAGEIRVLSMGLLADEDQALLWRGATVQRAVQQFIEDADWSGVDYLLIDTPPGTGDIAMAIARLLPRAGHLLVTTPARAAQRVASRTADFARKSNVDLLGVIENMAPLTCSCGETHSPFGHGGGAELAQELGVPLLASIPLDHVVAEGGDRGEPIGVTSGLFHALADRLTTEIAPQPVAGCTARLLAQLDDAIRANIETCESESSLPAATPQD
jgi:ATP-binding protein involved in chromosome partitioning